MTITLIRKRSLLLTTSSAIVVATAVFAQSGQPASQPPPGVDPATHAQHVQLGGVGGATHVTPPAGTPAAPDAQPMAGMGADANTDLVNQIAQLRAQVAQLQAALMQNHSAQPMQPPLAPSGMGMKNKPMAPSTPGKMGMGQMGGMGGAGMAAMPPQPTAPPGGMAGMGGAAGMSGGAGGGMMDMMGMMQQMMGKMEQMMGGMMGGGAMPMPPGAGASGGMGGMGDMPMMDKMMAKGMSQMGGGMNTGSMVSALPGFPGASHIYHLGATGFFLDHATHITLTTDQQTQLNQIKEASLSEQATLERKIEQGEQELWTLTASDAPDGAKVEAKAREIEKLRADQRIAFMRDVGKAAAVLTDEQRKQLTGMLPPAPTPPQQPAQGGGMGGHM